MRIYDIITKKKRGEELSDAEIEYVISEYTKGTIPDYQISALMMAIYFKSMTDRETATMTLAMAHSGDTVDLSEFGTLTVDKHSTGGVGDKTTLVIAPIAASLGAKLAKMSGRGLGHTGGTVDKLESFPGYDTSLSPEDFFDQVRRVGISVIGQSGNFAPADKKLYALRDVTATVDSIPLITASIMSKKLAAGSSAIVLDVKYGSGGFMKTPEDAEALANGMVEIGKRCGRRMCALITNMDIPLGYAIGNSLEVREALDVLSGKGPADLTEVCVALATEMVSLSLGMEHDAARTAVLDAISSGKALAKFAEWIEAQGGDPSYATDPSRFPRAKQVYEVKATRGGYISAMNAEEIGNASVVLGAGRLTKDDVIDHSAGIVLKKKLGDRVTEGEIIAELHTSTESKISSAERILLDAICISETAPHALPLIYKTVR
ncbi:MAG: pyrimidine-nucleoside phosphorylase [Clostridia bacterium]|nr:pyrimidine-nucleoside phosphorylase [Clostridia bacterium]